VVISIWNIVFWLRGSGRPLDEVDSTLSLSLMCDNPLSGRSSACQTQTNDKSQWIKNAIGGIVY
jgi:hypothetical protein